MGLQNCGLSEKLQFRQAKGDPKTTTEHWWCHNHTTTTTTELVDVDGITKGKSWRKKGNSKDKKSESPNAIWEVMNSNPVDDVDFFFVPRL